MKTPRKHLQRRLMNMVKISKMMSQDKGMAIPREIVVVDLVLNVVPISKTSQLPLKQMKV